MSTSIRSRALLLGSTLAPVAVVIVRFMYSRTKEVAEARGARMLDYHRGFLFDAMVVVGIVCLVGALISLCVDFRFGR